ncbi:SDR family NAD(P)-dependent oxidoreductase [Streptomyces sp. NRRL S-813]|uniref:SDR family NAD(P)-dependent oxidoreductase n=1 Tax=Streptomyces sp. NRRL S-813 TaxID=1463919 RepID=UPI0004C1C668|nr:SDR family oxidoreductase [Streptomyces sp. NRRL S-813]
MDHSHQPLDGAVALVTGATQGIGRAIAARLAHDGARVAVGDRAHTPAMDAIASAIGGVPAVADVSDRAQVHALVGRLNQQLGDIDVLVCNAAYMTMGRFTDHDEADWWKVVDTNLTGTFHLIQAVLPGMRRRGRGRIVVISSEWGVTGWPEATAYSASKAGLISLVKALGRELAPEGIVVNAVAPGVIDTPQLQVDADSAGLPLDDMHKLYAQNIPLGRIGRPEEIASAVALLTDFRVGSFVGQTLQINGGSTRCRV